MLSLFFMTKVFSTRRLARSLGEDRRSVSELEREIMSHLDAIALYEKEASSSDLQLRAFAQRILPQLRRHLNLLRSLKTGN